MKKSSYSNPYPKTVHPVSAKPSYVSPDLNLEAMRKEANRNNDQTAHINKPIQNLGGGPLKGEK